MIAKQDKILPNTLNSIIEKSEETRMKLNQALWVVYDVKEVKTEDIYLSQKL